MAEKNLIEIKIPYVDGDTSGSKISRIMKKPGDIVFQGEVIAEIGNDMFVYDVKSTSTGVISKFCKKVGENVKVDEVFALLSAGCDPELLRVKSQEAEREKKNKMVGSVVDIFRGLFNKRAAETGDATAMVPDLDTTNDEKEIELLFSDVAPDDAGENALSDEPDPRQIADADEADALARISKPNAIFNEPSGDEKIEEEMVLAEGAAELGIEMPADVGDEIIEKSNEHDAEKKEATKNAQVDVVVSADDAMPNDKAVIEMVSEPEFETIAEVDHGVEASSKQEHEPILEPVKTLVKPEDASEQITEESTKRALDRVKQAVTGRRPSSESDYSSLNERQRFLKELICKSNNKVRTDKKVNVFFSSITEKVDISSPIELIKKNSEYVYKLAKQKIGLDPFIIKAVGYALGKTSIFNPHVVNVVFEDRLYNRKTIITNMNMKSLLEISGELLLDKNHSAENAATLIINNSSLMSDPMYDGCVSFNKCFEEGEKTFMYVTVCCSHKQASIFLNYIVEFLQNPGCIIFDNVI